MGLNWSRTAAEYLERFEPSGPVGELIARFQERSPLDATNAVDSLLAEEQKSESTKFLLFAIRRAIADHALTEEEVRSLIHVRRMLRIEEGELLAHHRMEVVELLCQELQRLLEDQEIDPEEALLKVKLQEVLGLSYDQFVELTAPEIEKVVMSLLHVIEANGVEPFSREAINWFQSRLTALDTVYHLDRRILKTMHVRDRPDGHFLASPSRAGYLYLLINDAMPGVVKVGLTRRSARDRASDLSGATGVPTPFQVVLEVLVEDCAEAERLIHQELSARGYRIANNREFFRAPLHEVTQLMLQVRDRMPASPADLRRTTADHIAKAEEWLKAAKSLRQASYQTLIEEVLEEQDELLNLAAEIVIADNLASIEQLQRRLKIGYGRAARIMDQLQAAGIVGPADATRTRPVLASIDELDEMRGRPRGFSRERLARANREAEKRLQRRTRFLFAGLVIVFVVYGLLYLLYGLF